MKSKKPLKIFKKISIEYLKKRYRESIEYVFDKNTWRSTEPETFGESKVLLRTRKSLQKFGNDMKIFKAPTMHGLKIVYYKTYSLLFDNYALATKPATEADDDYLLRDLSSSEKDLTSTNKELRIFKLPKIENLEKLYFRKKNHLKE